MLHRAASAAGSAASVAGSAASSAANVIRRRSSSNSSAGRDEGSKLADALDAVEAFEATSGVAAKLAQNPKHFVGASASLALSVTPGTTLVKVSEPGVRPMVLVPLDGFARRFLTSAATACKAVGLKSLEASITDSVTGTKYHVVSTTAGDPTGTVPLADVQFRVETSVSNNVSLSMDSKIAGSPAVPLEDTFIKDRNVLRLVPNFYEFLSNRYSELQSAARAFEAKKGLPDEQDAQVTFSSAYKVNVTKGASIEAGIAVASTSVDTKSTTDAERSFQITINVTLYKAAELTALKTVKGRVRLAYGKRWEDVYDEYNRVVEAMKPGTKSSEPWTFNLSQLFDFFSSNTPEPNGDVLIAVRGEQACGKTSWIHSLFISLSGEWTEGVERGLPGEGVRPLWPNAQNFGTNTTNKRALRVGPLNFTAIDQQGHAAGSVPAQAPLPEGFDRENPLHIDVLVASFLSLWPDTNDITSAQETLRKLFGGAPCHVIVLTKPDEIMRKIDGKPEPSSEADLIKSIKETSDRWSEVQALCGRYAAQVAKVVHKDVYVTVVDLHVRTMQDGNPRSDEEAALIADRCVEAVLTVLRSAHDRKMS